MNKKIIVIGVVAIVIIAIICGYFILNRQKSDFPGNMPNGERTPPEGFQNMTEGRTMSQEAIQACNNLAESDLCNLTMNENTLAGKCQMTNEGLACMPDMPNERSGNN